MAEKPTCGACGASLPLPAKASCPYATCPQVSTRAVNLESLANSSKGWTCAVCRVPLPLAEKGACLFATCPQPLINTNTRSLADTSQMSGREFELYVKDRLAEKGYTSIETTPASGDMGGDLIVRHDGKVIVIQCKRYAGTVGVQAVQEVIGAKFFYEADEAWVVTNSKFTESALELARKAEVRLKTLILRPISS